MNKTFYKLLLSLLKGLVFLKRALFWVLGFVCKFLLLINDLYKHTLGFAIFKIFFYIKKYFNKFRFFKQESKIEFFGRRGTLQLAFFVVFFIIMIPHTRLYSKGLGEIPGRNSLFYSVIDHGDQDFYEDEIVNVDINAGQTSIGIDWKSGSVSSQDLKEATGQNNSNQDLLALTSGGTAVTKPTIIPGATIVSNNTNNDTQIIKNGSTEIKEYTVQNGDVIGAIAEKFGISVSTILWANNLNSRSYIRPGQVLTILPTDGVTHKVVGGDTVSKIARLYDAESEDIIKFNKLEEGGADIVIGEMLIIPGGEKQIAVVAPSKTTVVTRPSSFDNVVPVSSPETPAGSGYLWPTDARIITQYFGLTHNAIDIAGPIGTRIYATKAGKVITSQCGYNGGYGCYVKIDHGNGVISLYGHASKLLVNLGDYVTQGQNIMLMGSTGRSTGPHVHFEIRVNGRTQNPLSYVRKP